MYSVCIFYLFMCVYIMYIYINYSFYTSNYLWSRNVIFIYFATYVFLFPHTLSHSLTHNHTTQREATTITVLNLYFSIIIFFCYLRFTKINLDFQLFVCLFAFVFVYLNKLSHVLGKSAEPGIQVYT